MDRDRRRAARGSRARSSGVRSGAFDARCCSYCRKQALARPGVRRRVVRRRRDRVFEAGERFGQARRVERFERESPFDPVAERIISDAIRRRGAVRPLRGRRRVAIAVYGSQESIATPRHRLDIPRRARVVVERLANVGDRPRQRVLADMHVGPEPFEQVVLADERAAARDEMLKDVDEMRRERQIDAVADDDVPIGVEHERREDEARGHSQIVWRWDCEDQGTRAHSGALGAWCARCTGCEVRQVRRCARCTGAVRQVLQVRVLRHLRIGTSAPSTCAPGAPRTE